MSSPANFTSLRIEPLDPIKLPLITRLYKAHYPSAKAKKNELTIVGYTPLMDNAANSHDELCCVVRLRPIDPYRLLTGMLVLPDYRGNGIAHQLMQHCRQHMLTPNDYCFAYTHLAPFYAQHGFVTLEPDTLPPPLRTLFMRYCHSGKSLVAMQFQPTEAET